MPISTKNNVRGYKPEITKGENLPVCYVNVELQY